MIRIQSVVECSLHQPAGRADMQQRNRFRPVLSHLDRLASMPFECRWKPAWLVTTHVPAVDSDWNARWTTVTCWVSWCPPAVVQAVGVHTILHRVVYLPDFRRRPDPQSCHRRKLTVKRCHRTTASLAVLHGIGLVCVTRPELRPDQSREVLCRVPAVRTSSDGELRCSCAEDRTADAQETAFASAVQHQRPPGQQAYVTDLTQPQLLVQFRCAAVPDCTTVPCLRCRECGQQPVELLRRYVGDGWQTQWSKDLDCATVMWQRLARAKVSSQVATADYYATTYAGLWLRAVPVSPSTCASSRAEN